MRMLTICFVILLMLSGQTDANDQSLEDIKITLKLNSQSKILLTGYIAPIGDVVSDTMKDWEELKNLRVAESEKYYGASVFRDFLPNKPVSVGELWKVNPTGVITLLKQLHPKPNLELHNNAGDSRGLWACLRAFNDLYADIAFRIHAEFVMKEGWFTPSQFTGHLIIKRDEEKVVFFEMYVPGGTVNFDVNRITPGATISGVGFCPKMELRTGMKNFPDNVKFSKHITQNAAERALILRFYKSQQINWVQPDQVLDIVKAQQKPIHAISIDGPLFDEAC